MPAFGPGAIALAVYSEPTESGDVVVRRAADQGNEGIACVDDAARAAIVYARIWQRHRFEWAREAALGLLTFVRGMQQPDGNFANFIYTWDGKVNLVGPSSRPGGTPWLARAMHSLAAGVAAFGDEDCAESFKRGLRHLDRATPYFDVQSVSVLAALEYWRATGDDELSKRALNWSKEIAATTLDGALLNGAELPAVHLWGHLQEAALAEVGVALRRPELIRAARRSAETLLVRHAQEGFALAKCIAFDVSCVVHGLDAVAIATGEERYRRLAADARQWFDGRNTAGEPVYDRERGMVFDGIDYGIVNHDSGAESNIEGANALLDTLPFALY